MPPNSILQNLKLQIFYNSKLIHTFALNQREMRIVSHKKLKEFYETKGYEDSRIALERWYDITEKVEWKNLSEIKVDFPATDYLGNQHYVFNIRGNHYRLVVVVKFTMGYIFVRWIGTHKEYDKIDCLTI